MWLVCLTPLAMLVARAALDRLGTNPIELITHTLGDWTLRILLASLAVTPLRILTGMAWPITLRRLLGLFAFAYAVLLADQHEPVGQDFADRARRPRARGGGGGTSGEKEGAERERREPDAHRPRD